MWYFMSVPRKGKVGGPSTDATTDVYASAMTTTVAFAAPAFVAVVSVDVWLLQTELAEHNTRSKAVRRPLMRKQLIRFPVVIVLMWVSFLSCSVHTIRPIFEPTSHRSRKRVGELLSGDCILSGTSNSGIAPFDGSPPRWWNLNFDANGEATSGRPTRVRDGRGVQVRTAARRESRMGRRLRGSRDGV